MEYSPGGVKKDGRILVLAAAIITGLRLARDPRAGCLTERVIDAVEDGLFVSVRATHGLRASCFWRPKRQA
jgi:hypothetical protein